MTSSGNAGIDRDEEERELLRDDVPHRPPSAWNRVVGIFVLGSSVLAAALLAIAVAPEATPPLQSRAREVSVGIWEVFYDTQAPSYRSVLAAVAFALLIAAGVAVLERRIANRYRRSYDRIATPLAPRIVMEATRNEFAGPVTITVLIPAHNEEDCIGATIASLESQEPPPHRIVVVADNCTDGTVGIAREAGVEVFETVGNTHKKAGALNQALEQMLPGQGDNDLLMVMDADTVLDAGFLAEAARRMTADRALMAVGGLFYGEDGKGVLGQFQRNEYTRYARELGRRRGRVFVLTGTASIFRPRALRTVAASRGVLIPGHHGEVYDTVALTEDNELTIALKSLGGLMVSPPGCTVVTEVMPSWRALWNQRLRWQRGALENLGAYGMTPQTFRYWSQQLGIAYGSIAVSTYLILILLMLLALDVWIWFPFWVGIGLVFTMERVLTVWKGGWRARILGATLFPEMGYALFLNVVFIKGVLDITLRRQASWKHVTTVGGRVVVVEED
ncbi:glycosyltransferase family 2 protein [Nocardioides panacisoli]|uniref:glycosyltransferase family 2 protein n=1 Tax=Nocardioides panacisoli TaxID=627624 RepID=UPI001C63A9B1|nr:glycosyltransferase family 2 protein [Nocardioides panacisoli]QYJ05088.1 glycosyltransferase family 2 protein [Nocardioides panacisoli]